MIKNIRHTGIVVENLELSLDFYVNKLGFIISKKMLENGRFIEQILGIKAAEVTTVKLSLSDGQMIELLDYAKHKRAKKLMQINDIGPTHLAFTVVNLDALHQAFLTDGIEFISSPKLSPDGNVKVAFCKAPEGTYIELVEELTKVV